MNNTWHIHISGLVQGVGFRPYVHRMAEQMKINGTVANTTNGVHIKFNAAEHAAFGFYKSIIDQAPSDAVITYHEMRPLAPHLYNKFAIIESSNGSKPDMLLTPDISICDKCRKEINDINNIRYRYPFTTCLHCGPRYSIVTNLPYDRCNTSMNHLQMCTICSNEYNNINNRRHYSQTNSCPECTIPMHLYSNTGEELSGERETILTTVKMVLEQGQVAAVKAVGGYLLLCDATNEAAISLLRNRKNRPNKPFALLYASAEQAEKDVFITKKERAALESKAAPIVLCGIREDEKGNGVCTKLVAPGLNKLGVMLPCTGLLQIIAQEFQKPLIATSANIHGSPIIYKDEDALTFLPSFADVILTFERDIVAPQDDSVMQFTPAKQQRIILRRSRGLAPNYFPNPLTTSETLLAAGADMKASFAVLDKKNLYVSQFLGDQGNYESQISYRNTSNHLLNLLQVKPQQVLVDKHPGYYSSEWGKETAKAANIPVIEIQHHKAHFSSVLAENELLATDEPILGIVWDGTGFGDDEQVWGGEFFIYHDAEISRAAHFAYYPQLMGDKMSKEPRLSAVALLHDDEQSLRQVFSHFNETERSYLSKLIHQPHQLYTSSVGRILDGIASLLGIVQLNSYEGEGAMKLEALAERCNDKYLSFYPLPEVNGIIDWTPMLQGIIECKKRHIPPCRIAFKVFASLANCIKEFADNRGVHKIAFSGGVFQNALLVDLIEELLGRQYKLYYHKQLSPNDECISFGQVANYLTDYSTSGIYKSAIKETTCA